MKFGELFNKNKSPKEVKTTNPYTKAGISDKSTDDRYMNLATSKRNWQIAAFIFIGVIVYQSYQLGKVANESKIQPWLVAVNDGEIMQAIPADVMNETERTKLVKVYLQAFISDSRTVLGDEFAEKKLLDKVYARVSDRALPYINQWYEANDPLTIAATYRVSVDIVNFLPLSKDSYQVTWDETKRSAIDGSVMGTTRWVAQMTVKQVTPIKANMNFNPFGVYITDLTWSQSL